MAQEQTQQIPVPSTLETQTPTSMMSQRPTKGVTPLQYLVTLKDARDRDAASSHAVVSKYASIDSMQKADKIKALKDPSLNPYALTKPYDGLASSFEKWKTVAWSADLHSREGKPADYKEKVASAYYDKMIAPLYAAAKLEPMDKKVWMKSAYEDALNYKIEDAYNNSIYHQLRHGIDEGLAATARAYGFMSSVAGHVVDNVVDTWNKEKAFRAQPDVARDAELRRGSMADPLAQKAYGIDEAGSAKVNAWYAQVGKQTTPKTEPEKPSSLLAHIQEGAKIQDAKHEFFAQALPDYDGWFNHATSFVAEQVGQAPIFAAMELGMAPVQGMTLTKSLMSTPAGRKVIPYLMAGTEGTAYGVLTRPQNDKLQAWKDGVGFAIFHGMFDVAGLGLSKIMDVAVGPSRLEKLKARQDAYVLAQEGKRKATPVEQYKEHVKEVSNNLAVGGVATQSEIFKEALSHVHETEGMSRVERVKYEADLLKRDPAHAAPMLSSANFIRNSLETGTKIAEMSEEAKASLQQRLSKLVQDAGSSMNENVQGLEEHIAPRVAEQVKTAGGKKTLDFFRAYVTSSILEKDPTALKMMKPEQIDALAQKAMTTYEKRAAQLAERELVNNAVREATNANKRAAKAAKDHPAMQVRSQRSVNKYGEPAVRYSVNPNYKVQLGLYSKAAKSKGQSLGEFFEDMSNEDFARDLNTHFFPKVLADTGVFFEHQNTREGMQNPNFLGFMYNYVDKMPEEFGKELERRLIETMKVQTYMNGKKPTEPQLDYFSRAVWNHVDNFLASGRWPEESNIFRSTQDTMWQSTEWQMDLLRERMADEAKILKKAFSGNPKALRAAQVAYKLLADERIANYAKGPQDMLSQEYIRMTSSRITDKLTETGKFEKVDF